MRSTLILVAAALALASCASARGDERAIAFERRLTGFIDQLRADPLAPPGFVVVAVHGEDIVFARAYGVRDLATGAPMTLDTPVYNASVTKAYTGLLAAILDAEGVIRLDQSMSDVWPSLRLQAPLDASQISVEQLLSHTSGMADGGLQYRSVFTGDVSAAMTPEHLAQYAAPARAPGFQYSNLGPFVYSTMVETRTGEPWADALRRRVLAPLNLSRTMTRLEDLPADQVAHCNTRGADRAWRSVVHKPTATMNAAGGMYASGRDTARFLQAFLTDGASAGGVIPAETLRRTWAASAERTQDLLGMHRDGYGLGWDLGEMGGHRFVSRSGGYTGCRSFVMMFPELEFGVVALSAGDVGGNMFNAVVLRQALDYWTQADGADAQAGERVAAFVRSAQAEAARYDEAWDSRAGFGPVGAETARAVTGRFRNARLGEAVVRTEGEALIVQLGVLRSELRRGEDGALVVVSEGEPGALSFALTRDPAGRVTAVQWDDDLFARIE